MINDFTHPNFSNLLLCTQTAFHAGVFNLRTHGFYGLYGLGTLGNKIQNLQISIVRKLENTFCGFNDLIYGLEKKNLFCGLLLRILRNDITFANKVPFFYMYV